MNISEFIPARAWHGIAFLLLTGMQTVTARDFPTATLHTQSDARHLFLQAVEKQRDTDRVLEAFQTNTSLPPAIRLVYLGALQTLRARDTFFPWNKLKWLKRGLHTIQTARELDSLDLEVIFVQGVVWHKIPGLFGYKDDARRNFEKLVQLLPTHYQDYDAGFIKNMVQFLREESDLSALHIQKIAILENQNATQSSGELP